MLLSRVTPPTCCSRATSRPRCAVIRASGDNGSILQEGTKIKVTGEIKVFHAPKYPLGIDLSGKQGTIVKNVAYYKEKHLSPNLPYKVQFEFQQDGTPLKFFAHLAEDEVEVVA